MRSITRYGVAFAAMLIAIIGAGTALAHDDGTDAPFVIGTEVSDAFGKGGVVVANLNAKSYVWDEATGKCWAYQRQSVNDAGYTSSAVVPLENITGVCSRHIMHEPPPEPPPYEVCERVQLAPGYTYRMPVIESGGYAIGAVPATTHLVCTPVPTPPTGGGS